LKIAVVASGMQIVLVMLLEVESNEGASKAA
jgi:hypothetical protein